MLLAAVHNGGLAIGHLRVILWVYPLAFPVSIHSGWLRLKTTRMLAVHPDWRSKGIGFALKRAQWQMVRNRVSTVSPGPMILCLSRKRPLNIARRGAVCNYVSASGIW